MWLLLAVVATGPPGDIGHPACRCLDDTGLEKIHAANDHIFIRKYLHPSIPWALVNSHEYCYPREYGARVCFEWDAALPEDCAKPKNETDDICEGRYSARWDAPPWCAARWCYVAPDCALPKADSVFFPGRFYSYETCGNANTFELHGVPVHRLCEFYDANEKPYSVVWLSCVAAALLYALLDVLHPFEGKSDELSNLMRVFVIVECGFSAVTTMSILKQFEWSKALHTSLDELWRTYNLAVYLITHSSSLMSGVQLSMMSIAWFDCNFCQHPVFAFIDGHLQEQERPALLCVVCMVLCTAGLGPIIFVTHFLPGMVLYYWVFVTMIGACWKLRRFTLKIADLPGRALTVCLDSFLVGVCFQVLLTTMVRVYDQGSTTGYFGPLTSDIWSRRIDQWYMCKISDGLGAWTLDAWNLLF